MILTIEQLILNHATTDKSGKKLFTEAQVRLAWEIGKTDKNIKLELKKTGSSVELADENR